MVALQTNLQEMKGLFGTVVKASFDTKVGYDLECALMMNLSDFFKMFSGS